MSAEDLSKRIESSVSSRQRMTIKGGTLWRRGGLLTAVLVAVGGDVEWLDEDGVRVEGTPKGFRSRTRGRSGMPASAAACIERPIVVM